PAGLGPVVCRHLAWLGAPRSVADLVLEPEQGLLVQSYAPRRQRYGRINADGWGVGLFAADGPHRWRSSRPIWSDASFASIAALVFATGVEQMGELVLDVGTKDPAARLNLLLADGDRLLATTWGDTLSYLVAADGIAVASEPWDDDPNWVDVPDRSLLEVTR